MSLLVRDGDSTASEYDDEDEAVKKPNRGRSVDWKNIATFNNEMDAKNYMFEVNPASRGHRGNKVKNKISLIWKSESKTTTYRERIVITLEGQSVMLQACGDDEDFQDVENKRIADEVRIIIDRYRERGISGGKQVLRLWSSDHPTIVPPTVKQVSNRNA